MTQNTSTSSGVECLKQQVDAAISPAVFAATVSQGRWKMARHLAYLDRALTDTIRTSGRLIVTCPPRHGKLCAHDTPVLTSKGWRTHGELRPGDFVFGPDGKQTRVLAISEDGLATHEVEFTNGETVLCHGAHEWCVWDRGDRAYRIVETEWFTGSHGGGSQFELPTTLTRRRRIGIADVRVSENAKPGRCIQVDRPDGLYLVGRSMLPTHNSELLSKYLPAWFLGTFPDRRVMLGGYGAQFAGHWGKMARRLMERHGQEYFGVTVDRRTSASDDWAIDGREGGMQTAGTGGGFSGKGADLLLLDDPIKGFEQANSLVYREKVWQWFLHDAYTRLSPTAAAVLVQTRWHEDDLAGRILKRAEDVGLNWRLVNLPAFAEENDPLGRKRGDPLWPERFDHAWLTAQRKMLGSYPWSSLYQQRPQPPEGGRFKRHWFKIVDRLPEKIDKAVRYWDFGYTQDGGDYTASMVVCESDGLFYLAACVRGQWSALRRQEVMSQVAAMDRTLFGEGLKTWIPQDPAAGKEVAELEIRRMAKEGFRIKAETQHGKKEINAMPLAAAAEEGAVRMVAGKWNAAAIDEFCSFPTGTHDDIVDSACRAFNKVAKPRAIFEIGVY